MPLPPGIGSRITGALITLLSSTMANGLPTLSRVASPNRLAPAASKRKLTTGSLFLKVGCASTQRVAADHHAACARHRRAARQERRALLGRRQYPVAGGSRPRRASSTETPASTSWKVSFAVWPSSALTCSGLSTPGNWTRMRSYPSRWIVGSFVPVSSMRRRMISMD